MLLCPDIVEESSGFFATLDKDSRISNFWVTNPTERTVSLRFDFFGVEGSEKVFGDAMECFDNCAV